MASPAKVASSPEPLGVLSLGAGVQSTTLALMAAHDELGPRAGLRDPRRHRLGAAGHLQPSRLGSCRERPPVPDARRRSRSENASSRSTRSRLE